MKARSITLRLALSYTAAFALAIATLGVVVLLGTRATLRAQFETRIRAEATALTAESRTEGIEEVAHAVRDRDMTSGALSYGLQSPDGRRMAGRLAGVHAPLGWSTIEREGRGAATAQIRILVVKLPDGHSLIVGDDLSHVQSLDGVLLPGFALVILFLVVCGGGGGYLLSRGVRRRFAAINAVAEAVSEGDLRQRVTLGRGADDLDHLGLAFNRMLDRIVALLENLRQVSNDVAHDLRTPLTRLRQRLEGALHSQDEAARHSAIEEALTDLDAIMETFAATLRIAQIESGSRRAGFGRVDLAVLARNIVESFAPSAEEGGRSLVLEARDPAIITGDAELLTQMIVNLVENGLRHTPVGSRVRVGVVKMGGAVVLRVADDGPGVPQAERRNILKRFYRLEQSRSTPGSGLGLALVAAVAGLHEARVQLADADPGLEVQVHFTTQRGFIGDFQSCGQGDERRRSLG